MPTQNIEEACKMPSVRQIREQMEIQDKHLSELSDLFEQLEDKLKTVIFNEEVSESSQLEHIKTLVPLADEIRNNNNIIQTKIIDLRSIIERIEL